MERAGELVRASTVVVLVVVRQVVSSGGTSYDRIEPGLDLWLWELSWKGLEARAGAFLGAFHGASGGS